MLTTEENIKLFVEWYFEVEEQEKLTYKFFKPTSASTMTENKEIDIYARSNGEIEVKEQYTGVEKRYRLIDSVHTMKYERIG